MDRAEIKTKEICAQLGLELETSSSEVRCVGHVVHNLTLDLPW